MEERGDWETKGGGQVSSALEDFEPLKSSTTLGAIREPGEPGLNFGKLQIPCIGGSRRSATSDNDEE